MIKTYLKIAWRNLVKNKDYTFINIAGLALSITCGILIFTLVQYHLGFDNFHANSNRIYRFVTEQHRDNISYVSSVPPAFGHAFEKDYTFGEQTAQVATFEEELVTVLDDKEPKKFKEKKGFSFAEESFFSIFNYPLLEGSKKTVLAEPNTAIITQHIAEKYFGKTSPINKTLRLSNKVDVRITGILQNIPTNSDRQTEIYVSYPTLKQYAEWFADDNAWGGIGTSLQCYVLLKPSVAPAQVEKVLPAYVTKFRPKSKNVHHYKLQPFADIHFDSRYGGIMEKKNVWILSLIGVFLIITACVNFINLATAQALKRSKEVGVRKVLGSMKSQLFWQFIAETGLITVVAATIAVGLSYVALPYLNEWFTSKMSIHLISNWKLLSFIPLLAIVVTFLAGAYPGFILAGFKPIAALKGKLTQQQVGGFNTRRTLIISQFAISMALIIGMIVITKQMRYAKQSDLGFDKTGVVMLPIGADSLDATSNTIKNKLSQVSGVEKISLCFAAPSSDKNWNNSIYYDNSTEEVPFRTSIKAADDQYISTFGLKLVTGRNLFPSDSVREAVVNETLAKKLNLTSPEALLGKNIKMNGGSMSATIVGVVKDFHDQSFHEDINPVCITTYPTNYDTYAVKINLSHVKETLASIEKIWTGLRPEQVYEYRFLNESIAEFYETEETMLLLVQAFSFIAIFIGCLGLYGLISFMAAQKNKEIGIRKVLGGTVAQILWIFGKEFSRLIVIAFLIAAPIAWWLMNTWLQDFKFRITIGPAIFIAAIASTLVIALITIGYQAAKAALMNPVKSLRSE